MQIEQDGKTYRLRKLSNSPYWYVEWREDGKPQRRSTGSTDQETAAQFLTAFVRGITAPESPGLIPDILDHYFEHHAKDKASAEQAAIYIRHLKRLIGATAPADLTKEVQRDYIRKRQAEHKKKYKREISSETVNRELTVLSAAIRFYYDDKSIQYAPPRVKLLKRKQSRDKWLSRSQIGQLLWRLHRGGYPTEHLKLFVRLGIYSGPRPGQITGLTWDRVDFETRAIWYFDPDDEETNKRAEVVDMSEKIYTILKRARARQEQLAKQRAERYGETYREPTHVIEYKAAPVDKIHRAFKRHTQALGWEDITPNTLRHTFATHAARHANEVDMTLMDLMRAMGHSSIKTTMRYAKHMPGRHKKVLEAARRKKPKSKE